MSEKKPSIEKTRDMKPFGLRLLPDLKKKVEERAEKAGRSLNAQIAIELENHPLLVLWWEGWVPEREQLESENSALERKIIRLQSELDEARRLQMQEHERWSLLTHRRIPEGLYARIQTKAMLNERTVEEEVLEVLEKAFPVAKTAQELASILAVLLKPLDGWEPKDTEQGRHIKLMREHLVKLQAAVRGEGDPEAAVAAYRADFPAME